MKKKISIFLLVIFVISSLIACNGAFFTLTEAYDKGHLTNQDMADIENAQRQYYEFLYSDPE